MTIDILATLREAKEALISASYCNPYHGKNEQESIANLTAAIEQIEKAEPVLCVNSRRLANMRSADMSIPAWLPPVTSQEDIPLYLHPVAPTIPENKVAFPDEKALDEIALDMAAVISGLQMCPSESVTLFARRLAARILGEKK